MKSQKSREITHKCMKCHLCVWQQHSEWRQNKKLTVSVRHSMKLTLQAEIRFKQYHKRKRKERYRKPENFTPSFVHVTKNCLQSYTAEASITHIGGHRELRYSQVLEWCQSASAHRSLTPAHTFTFYTTI